jgi:hypothetical protein
MHDGKLADIYVIPEEDRIQELEEKVQYYMETTPESPRNTILYRPTKRPDFTSNTDRKIWERTEIERCRKGFNGLTGKNYFYINYCYMQHGARGKILPDFRVADKMWWDLMHECQTSNQYGIVCVKRRRVGASWKEAADALHDAIFNSLYHVGMNSMSEKDSIELFLKVKYIYSNLPGFLRSSSEAGNTKMSLFFASRKKDEYGNHILVGPQSRITVVPPTDSAYEGLLLHKWICDEAGKIGNLPQLWAYTEPCLLTGLQRTGTPVLFGTSGDITKDGAGLREMWDNSESYDLKKFFFAGWMGLDGCYDEYGNDYKEDAVRYIIYKRYKKRNLSPKSYYDFVQQYPLTTEEAFAIAPTKGLGDPVLLNTQISELRKNPPETKRGFFKMDSEGVVSFVPSQSGKFIIYEDPKDNQPYISGCDPADHDDVFETASDLSMYIMTQPMGLEGSKIVAEYTDRPAKLSKYYDQALMALIYYNNSQMLIENNRYRMISYFEENGYKKLLKSAPISIKQFRQRAANTPGVRMNDDMKGYLEELVHEYIDDYYYLIPSLPLLEEFPKYGSQNTDKVMAFGVTLIFLKELRRRTRTYDEQQKMQSLNKLVRGPGGHLVRQVE